MGKIKIKEEDRIKEEILFIDYETFKVWIDKNIELDGTHYRISVLCLEGCEIIPEEINNLRDKHSSLQEAFDVIINLLTIEKQHIKTQKKINLG